MLCRRGKGEACPSACPGQSRHRVQHRQHARRPRAGSIRRPAGNPLEEVRLRPVRGANVHRRTFSVVITSTPNGARPGSPRRPKPSPDVSPRFQNNHEHSLSNCRLRQHRAGPAPNPRADDRPNGPALEDETMLAAVLDPWAGHAGYEAANLPKTFPAAKSGSSASAPKPGFSRS